MDVIYTGDYAVRPFEILDKVTGEPFPLTGYIVQYRAEREGVPSVLELDYDSSTNPEVVVITDAALGKVEVRVPGSATALFVVDATYFEQVRVEDDGGDKNVTIEQRFLVKRAF